MPDIKKISQKSLQELAQKMAGFYDFNVQIGYEKQVIKEAKPKEKGLSSFAGMSIRKRGTKPFTNKKGKTFTTIDFNKSMERRKRSYLQMAFKKQFVQGKPKNEALLKYVGTPNLDKDKRQKLIATTIRAGIEGTLVDGNYGKVSKERAEEKGFKNAGIDTGQLVKSLRINVE